MVGSEEVKVKNRSSIKLLLIILLRNIIIRTKHAVFFKPRPSVFQNNILANVVHIPSTHWV